MPRCRRWLRAGRTELEVAADIAQAITAEGHARADFVIVGSGPNAASPHHEPSSRVLQPGDAVVVDIGGTMPSGYCSDCTRVYAIGQPPAEFTAYYQVLRDAQEAACAAVRPGATAEAVDAAAREPITAAGYGAQFVHRTGHGIGLETHEDPYIVAGNDERLEPGMAFSVEPGIYPGPHGARIEDIVVCTEQGCERLNNVTRELRRGLAARGSAARGQLSAAPSAAGCPMDSALTGSKNCRLDVCTASSTGCPALDLAARRHPGRPQ